MRPRNLFDELPEPEDVFQDLETMAEEIESALNTASDLEEDDDDGDTN